MAVYFVRELSNTEEAGTEFTWEPRFDRVAVEKL